jgi:hypothetical protein
VTLFGAIFAFVTRFPQPPAQDVNQFEASVVQNSSGITQLKILLESGPTVSPGTEVILQSSRTASNWQFSAPSGVPVNWGTGNNSKGWSSGQYWTTTFTPALKIPTNITIFILSSSDLLFNGVVPGFATNTPPVVTSTYTVPTAPAIGAAFQIFAVISGNTSGLVVNISLSEVPGLSSLGTPLMTYNATAEAWMYAVPSGDTTTAGSYLAFIQGSSSTTGATVAGSVGIVIPGSGGGGGGGGSSILSVSVGMTPQPPTYPQQTPAAYFWATVNYPGSKSNVPVSVNFTITQVVGGRPSSTPLTLTTIIPGQTGQTISGPSTLTVYSQTLFNFNSWIFNSSVVVNATATLGQSVGSATGNIVFSTPNLIQAIVYFTTSSSGSTGSETNSFSHSCGSCPYAYAEIWDNYTAALGGPATVTVSGVAWANTTTGTTHHFEIPAGGISSTTVTQTTSPLFLNLNGGTTRESEVTSAGTYSLTIFLTVRSTASGTPIIGYILDNFRFTAT